MTDIASSAAVRRMVYSLLIVTSTASMVGRICVVKSESGKTAMLSANDRSRWCTIRALVDHGTYAIDEVIQRGTDWYSIDMVRHPGRDGVEHFFSSKPPLLPTLLAGQYWLIKQFTGTDLVDSPFYIARIMLLLTNIAPLVLYFVVLGRLVESLGTTDWGRLFVMAAATWGTFLSTFAVTLNNHLPAAISVLLAVYAAIQIIREGDHRLRWFAFSGGFAAFAVANELPALSLLAMLFVALLWLAPKQALLGFVPAAGVVAAAFFFTNYIAHDSLRPPYAHREDGANWYDYEGSYWTEENKRGVDRGEPRQDIYAFHSLLGHHGVFSLTPVWLLSLVGIGIWLFRGEAALRALALMVLVLFVVCAAFYIMRPELDRNYGGVSCGFRWLFWFIPLWLLCLLPAADAIADNRWCRGAALVLLALSVASATYASLDPWSHPWLFDYWTNLGWIQY